MAHAPARKVVVGIDYGTSKTCVTHAMWDPENTGDDNSTIKILYFDGEPSVPSKIAIGRNQQVFWGGKVNTQVPGYIWSKVLLDDGFAHAGFQPALAEVVRRGFLGLAAGAEAQRVVKIFLTYLYSQVSMTLPNAYPRGYDGVEYVFAIPAVWSDRTKEVMQQIVHQAGFGIMPGEVVSFMSEAEAAALCVIDRIEQLPVTFPPPMLAAVSSLLTSLYELEAPFDQYASRSLNAAAIVYMVFNLTNLKDITALQVSNTGFAYEYANLSTETSLRDGGAEVDCQLLALLYRKREELVTRALNERETMVQTMENVEQQKINFPGTGIRIVNVLDEQMEILPEEMCGVLDPVVNRIARSVLGATTIQPPGKQSYVVPYVFLVGGFGQSPYLRQRVELLLGTSSTLKSQDVYWPHHVAYGAAMSGLQRVRAQRPVCDRHYGLLSNQLPGSDGRSLNMFMPHEPQPVVWLIHKNIEFREDSPEVARILLVYKGGASDTLGIRVVDYAGSGNPPMHSTGPVGDVATITCSLTNLPIHLATRRQVNGQTWWFLAAAVRWRVVTPINGKKALKLEVFLSDFNAMIGALEVPIEG